MAVEVLKYENFVQWSFFFVREKNFFELFNKQRDNNLSRVLKKYQKKILINFREDY